MTTDSALPVRSEAMAKSIFEQWGVTPVINVAGSVTRLGGAPMPAEVLAAFAAAVADSVPLDVLQGAASRVIAEATGAEAGIVTAGAAAGLLLGTAAILTRFDLRRMEKLPRCDEFPDEFVVAREHRNGYDHAVRAAGATLVEVGFHEIVAGAGVRRVEAWEYEAAFGVQTAGVLYVHDADSRPPLADVVRAAHARGFPVLVDAAGELPPRSNLRDLIAAGADLVVFSGGKAIRGPQASGILCGRRELVGAALLQTLDLDDHFELWEPPAELIDKGRLSGLPRHGIGRTCKVAKEQIAALLTALQLFTGGAYDAELAQKRNYLEEIAAGLRGLPVETRLRVPADAQGLPVLEVQLAAGRSALEVCRRLRKGQPPVQVGHGELHAGRLLVNPMHLNAERTAAVLRRLREVLTA
jgi:L-seryl-tRNA(Ser) seleniumtransferase